MKRLLLFTVLSAPAAQAGEPTRMDCDFAVLEKRTGITYLERKQQRLQASPDGAFAALFIESRQLAMRGQVSLRTWSSSAPRFYLFIYEDDYLTHLADSRSDGNEARVEWESRDRKASVHCRLEE